MTTLLQKMQSTYYIAFKGMYDDVVAGKIMKGLATLYTAYTMAFTANSRCTDVITFPFPCSPHRGTGGAHVPEASWPHV